MKIVLLTILFLAVIVLVYKSFSPRADAPATPPEQSTQQDQEQAVGPQPSNNNAYEYKTSIASKLPQYIREVPDSKWPPEVLRSTTPYSCTPTQSPGAEKAPRVINGTQYCVETLTEGAAGTTYYTHTYTTAASGGTASTTFSIGYPQCENYDEPQRTSCKTTQSNFTEDLDWYIDSLLK